MKILTVIGARPQFIKAAAVSRVIRNDYGNEIEEILVHTGQHYDANMSEIFFEELDIPRPKYNLEVSSGLHGEMTGRMLESVESVLIKENPDWVIIYGDTNSTLAGALAASKLHIPIAHIEAGLRSFNMRMPEEINRLLSDRVSSILLCPTDTAVQNLLSEGIKTGVYNVGDVMYDVALFYGLRARERSRVLSDLNLSHGGFALATCHRAENTDDPQKLNFILSALSKIALELPVVLPLHPRTRKYITEYGLSSHLRSLIVTEPLSFVDMIALEQSSKIIFTDSGGVQKEAFFYDVPCITLREETEWVETVKLGRNFLVGSSYEKIISAAHEAINKNLGASNVFPYGRGDAAKDILKLLAQSPDNKLLIN